MFVIIKAKKKNTGKENLTVAWWPGKVTILQGARNLYRYSEEKRYGGLWSKTRNWKWTIQSFASKYATACSYLPVETHVKSSTSRRTMSRKTDRQQPLQEKAAWSTHGGVADFTPHQLHEFCGVVQDLVERDVGAKRNPSRVDEPDPEWWMVTPMMMTYLSEGHNGWADYPWGWLMMYQVNHPFNRAPQQEFKGSQYHIRSSYGNLFEYHGYCNLLCHPIAILCPFQYHFRWCIRCQPGVNDKPWDIRLRNCLKLLKPRLR